MTEEERPQPRSRPRPASDESVDPVQGASPNVATPAGPQRDSSSALAAEFVDRSPEATVQLNVRVKSGTSATIALIQRKTGWTKRQIVERGADLLAQHLDAS